MLQVQHNTTNNNQEFTRTFLKVLKDYEQHRQIYEHANIDSFLLTMQASNKHDQVIFEFIQSMQNPDNLPV